MKDIRRTVMILWQLAILISGNFMKDAGNLFITQRLVGFKERKILLFEANEMLSYAAIFNYSCPGFLISNPCLLCCETNRRRVMI
jgi:hypothetical protein